MVTTGHAASYNAVWRWHFYAGVFCVPFVVWLALTGSIYLWRPQIEAWLDRPYDRLATAGSPASPDAQVAAALRAVPGSTLHDYILPEAPDRAVRILVTRRGVDSRVYVNPRSLAVLGVATEEKRPLRVILHLHGELLAGRVGSYLVEVAACWAIVMLLTGLYLWWPRGRRGWAGVLYPRLGGGGRLFWRDIHATAGIWVSLAALGLILTGLPWAEGWGNYLTEMRRLTGTLDGPPDWPIGGALLQVGPQAGPQVGPKAGAKADPHAGHASHAGMAGMGSMAASRPP
ncbi:PepSY-associated TM helix domain-containing protein, partial [Sphingomonas bacterium]|uniref:PepSY-associated TM helix domain-containing protein n=1 Tax=Sphingomonas bacterium TaxID=1895847 RepID=UPI0015754985